MALPKQDDTSQKMTEADYLAWEAQQEARYEFANGEVVMMAGGSPEHALIIINIAASLHQLLRRTPCSVYSESMRVKVAKSHRYPDLSVACGELDLTDDNPPSLLNPTVLVEVLSDTTKLRDRGEKLNEYIKIESLQHYLIVAQDTPYIELFTRTDEGWLYQVFEGIDQQVRLAALNCTLQLADVYEGVTFASENDDTPTDVSG